MENNSTIRKIFFWFLVFLFLLTAPAISLYALGYRFSFEKGIFVYSGSFTIKPTPQEPEIHLDGKSVPRGIVNFLNYSYHIDGLRPGTYSLEVKKDNYQTWHKQSQIHSGLSTEFWNVFLARENYTQKNYEIDPISDFFISPREKNIALVHNNPEISVRVLDLKSEKVKEVFSNEEHQFPSSEKINIEWSPKGDLLIVPAIQNESQERNYFIAGLKDEEMINLKKHLDLEESSIENVRWDPSDKEFILFVSQDNLYRASIKDTEEKMLLVQNIGGYDISDSKIYYINKDNGIIYKKSPGNAEIGNQITSKSLENIEFNDLKLIVYDENRIGIISGNGELYVFNDQENLFFEKVSENVLGLHYSNDGKKIAYWTDNEIFTYFTKKWETQPTREEGQIIHLTRSFDRIDNVQWLRDYEHLIYSSGNKIKLIELDHRDYRNIFEIVTLNSSESKVVYNPSKSLLYFSDSEDNSNFNLNVINLLERDDEEIEFY
jgi:hypothetical protein